MSVDLPAPFSPTSAWISPSLRSKVTPSKAFTPGKDFVISVIVRRDVILSGTPASARLARTDRTHPCVRFTRILAGVSRSHARKDAREPQARMPALLRFRPLILRHVLVDLF